MQRTADKHEIRYFCQNPETHKFERVFPESEIADDELVVPMFWGGQLGYVTVPGTEFYGPVPETGI
jgi:pyruvate-formate lyase-activating enzyme